MNPYSGTGLADVFFQKDLLWGLFGVFFIVFVILSVVLIYHWQRYGMSNKKIILAQSVYLIVSLVFIVVAVTTLISI